MTLNYLPKQLNKCINDKKNHSNPDYILFLFISYSSSFGLAITSTAFHGPGQRICK